MAASQKPGRNHNSRRRRPGRTGGKRGRTEGQAADKIAPLKALNQAKPTLGDKAADDPLAPAEVVEMKEHFRFLRTHKKLLKLRLNAAEDLLLNGVREPTHRGVCQHLLSKVEKDRVLAVSERLAPAEAARLLAGVLRFAPEVAYVLAYLKQVSSMSSQPEAARAVAHALKHIQFNETSSAQMREILALMVEVFPSEEHPVLIFNWLYNGAFRRAFDRSSEALPESLSRLVLPLRAVHQALTRDPKGADKSHSAELSVGVGLLLSAKSLNELPEPVRQRALDLALTAELSDPRIARGLRRLFEGMAWPNAEVRGQVALEVVGVLLAAGEEKEAMSMLSTDVFDAKSAIIKKSIQSALRAPRVGKIAIEERAPRARRRSQEADPGSSDPPLNRWLRGFHVPTQRRVRLRYGSAADEAEYAQQLDVWHSVLLPNVLRPLDFEVATEQPHVAVELVGKSLRHYVPRTSAARRRCCLELCQLLCALALSGVCLPDADENRFSVDEADRIWLVDLWGCQVSDALLARARHLELARALLGRLLDKWGAPTSLDDVATFTALAQKFERPMNN